jgi:hypothetical protein
VKDDPGAATGRRGDMPGISPSDEAGLRLSTSLDLAEIASLVLDAVVPAFADAAGVYVMEQLLEGEYGHRENGGEVTVRRLGARFASQRAPLAAFPPSEVIAFAARSPYARCVNSGETVIFRQPDTQTLDRARPGGREVLSRYASFLAVPLSASGAITGFLAFARAADATAFRDSDAAAAGRLAAEAGAGIANALLLIRQRSIADALQRGLLAPEMPVPAQLEVAGRCLPAAGQVVGGDWYDIICLPAGRTALIVGDVMGHGPEAAAMMAQLRAAAHALAQLDLEPAELLGHLDRTTATLRSVMLATCVYAVIDPDGQSCTISAAGHLPPVLAMPDGTTRIPDLPPGQSLGLGSAVYGQARIKLPPGAIIALYTDGLVETRTRPFDQGIRTLRSLLAGEHGQLQATCDTLIGSLAQRYEDDVTLILARSSVPGISGGLANPHD